ncbi:MAG: ATP-binding cassette domain-containing protein [Actinomycetota bacterium]|nr:ATP-binding cassette domain-containing protein [Actinomycetota bacterium]
MRTHSLSLVDVTVSHGVTEVLASASLTVGAGSRIGVVGPNGVGKTTLLRLLAGLGSPDRGAVRRMPSDLRVGYLPQELDARDGETLRAYLERSTGRADGRVAAVAADLGLTGRLDQRLETLSGGQAARARLAGLLLARFDVYCLDEPTNDLDFDGLERLARFVEGLQGSVVVVSHDRAFLDRTVSRIVELEEGSRRLREWPGGWSEYERARDRDRETQYRRFEDTEMRRRELEGLVGQRRGQARGGASLGKRTGGADRRGTKALRSKVRQAERALERLEPVEKPFEPWRLRLELEPVARSGDLVVRLEQVVVERAEFRLGPLDFELYRGDRVAVVGRNGSGKSTLLGAIAGSVSLISGRRELGRGAVLGELDQTRARFAVDASLVEAFGGPAEAARTLLAKFGLGADDVLRPARTLSPGERTRAQLAKLAAEGVNCLLLDEPTNHLDLPAIEELEAALEGYPGAVVLVTHDRRLLERFGATRRVEL